MELLRTRCNDSSARWKAEQCLCLSTSPTLWLARVLVQYCRLIRSLVSELVRNVLFENANVRCDRARQCAVVACLHSHVFPQVASNVLALFQLGM